MVRIMGAASNSEKHALALPVGFQLKDGHYQILEVIASGGFGITYLARDKQGREVAIKECFPPALATRKADRSITALTSGSSVNLKTALGKFRREAMTLQKLNHPNIVNVYDEFRELGTAFMVMDYIPGEDFLKQIKRAGAKGVAPDKVELIAKAMGRALAHVHKSDVLHRDVNPRNIRMSTGGAPILIDFGAARAETLEMTELDGTFLSISHGYTAPELYHRSDGDGPESDLYGLAAVLYHAITGDAPTNAQTRLYRAEKDPHRPLGSRFPKFDRNLTELIDQSLELDRKKRPRSAEEWLTRLDGSKTRVWSRKGSDDKEPTQETRLERTDRTKPPVPERTARIRKSVLSLGLVTALGAGAFAVGGNTLPDDSAVAQAWAATVGWVMPQPDARDDPDPIPRPEPEPEPDIEPTPTPTVSPNCPNQHIRRGPTITADGDRLYAPETYQTTAGTSVRLAECNLPIQSFGFVGSQPSFTLFLTEMDLYGRFEIEVSSSCDTVLLVQDAFGRWHFNDDRDSQDLSSILNLRDTLALNGQVDVYVGTFSNTNTICQAMVEFETWRE